MKDYKYNFTELFCSAYTWKRFRQGVIDSFVTAAFILTICSLGGSLTITYTGDKVLEYWELSIFMYCIAAIHTAIIFGMRSLVKLIVILVITSAWCWLYKNCPNECEAGKLREQYRDLIK